MSDKTRTITLTDRAPVKIVEAEWPVIAQAEGDDYEGNDYARHQQASAQGECTEYALHVRLHADGRALVYGTLSAGWHATESWRGGELCGSGENIAAALRRVGESGGLPDCVIRDAIAALPAEEL